MVHLFAIQHGLHHFNMLLHALFHLRIIHHLLHVSHIHLSTVWPHILHHVLHHLPAHFRSLSHVLHHHGAHGRVLHHLHHLLFLLLHVLLPFLGKTVV